MQFQNNVVQKWKHKMERFFSFLFVSVGMLSPELFDVGLFPLLGG